MQPSQNELLSPTLRMNIDRPCDPPASALKRIFPAENTGEVTYS